MLHQTLAFNFGLTFGCPTSISPVCWRRQYEPRCPEFDIFLQRSSPRSISLPDIEWFHDDVQTCGNRIERS